MEEIKILPRALYLNKIRPYIDRGIIKVLVGQRRVGKSYLLMSVAEEIKQRNPDANFIEINLEDFAFSHIHDAADLHNEISSRLKRDRKNYIFLDEIQEVSDFDKVVRSLILDPLNDVYLTGSNSSMLSSEIASRLAGRSIAIHVHPLSYKEFLDFHSLPDTDGALELYLRFGGLPYLINLPQSSTWAEYLSGVTDAIVFRDVVSRHSLRNSDFLGRLLLFLADNIGRIFSAKKIADYLKSQRVSSSVTGVQAYVEHVADALIINRVRRWDISGKKFFEIGEKYFFEDLGIRNSIIGYRPGDIGGLMENAVYNHLAAMGYEVKVGVLSQDMEIDFIAEKGNERRYIQVALTVTDEQTHEREFGNLSRIPDNYEKTVVSLRESAPNTYDGIRLMSLREFLLS
ncbi:MAG: ATP-binding protein [Muribaculaceae bacterium]|nr:ATP-binding protein [Muribaculaceae bacterium]